MALEFGFPRRPYAELYLADSISDWRNLVTHIRQNPGVKIEHARKSEQADPTPSECTFTLDDGPDFGNGDYSPRNPNGQWYPSFGRNIPFRYGFEFTDDDFNRTVVSGWGNSSLHSSPWSEIDNSGTFTTEVDGGEGRHEITTTSSWVLSYLDDVSIRNVDVAVTFALMDAPFASILGGPLEPANIALRGQANDDHFLCRMTIDASEQVTLNIRRIGSDGEFSLATSAVIGTWAGETWRVRANVDGRTLRMKAWAIVDGEPIDWQLQYTMVDHVYGSGWVGVRSGVGAGNSNTKPIVFRYEDFRVRIPRFTGETSVVLPGKDLSEKNRVTFIECGTIFRRKEQGRAPVISALRRYMVENAPGAIGYWPAEDDKFASQIAPGIGSAPMLIGGATNTTGIVALGTGTNTVEFGADDSIAASAPLPHTNLSTWNVYLTDFTDTGRFDIRFLVNVPDQNTSDVWVMELYTRGTANRWNFQLETDGSFSLRAFDKESTIILDDAGNSVMFDQPAMWYIQLIQDGADVDYFITFLRVGEDVVFNYTSGVLSGYTIGRVITFGQLSGFEGLDLTPEDLVLGHMFIGNEVWASSGFIAPLSGYSGELACARLARLAAENGLAEIGQMNGPDTSAAMGPQQVDTLLNLILECAATDHGFLFDSRVANSFSYIPLEWLYDQNATPSVVLDHDDFHLAEEFEPLEDDEGTVNDVTVKARRGTAVQKQQLTGPLNVNDPGTVEGAVGLYDKSFTINPATGFQLEESASWILHLGTTEDPRFPEISIDMASPTIENDLALSLAIMDTDVGDVIAVDNLQEWYIFDRVAQFCLGYTEILEDENGKHTISFNTAPASPYNVGRLGDIRLDSDDSSLNEDITTATASFDVTTPDLLTRWVVESDEILSGQCTGTGTSVTPNYIIATDSDATDMNIGDQGYLYTSEGVLKEATEFTITGLNSAFGFTNVEFSPNAAVNTASGDIFRTHYAVNFPFDIMVGGERMTVTDIDLTSDPQLFTVTRSANSVVKSHSTGAKVQLADPYYLAK